MELLIKASLALAIALVFYKLVLQQESFFATNRIYLLACLILAFTIPNITLPRLVEQQGYISSLLNEAESPKAVLQQPVIPEEPAPILKDATALHFDQTLSSNYSEAAAEKASATAIPEASLSVTPNNKMETVNLKTAPATSEIIGETKSLNFSFWITAIYLFGVAIFSFSLLFQLCTICLKIRRSKDKVKDGECVIVNTAQKQAPCSFFNYVFIYPDEYDFEAYEQIIAHEKTHVRLGHSFDLLLAEIAVILLWFNPLIWLFRKEIEKNNEYQTDALLLQKEQVRKDSYQLNLLQIAVPNKPLKITTNYNQSLLKQRIMMMNSKKSTPNAYWKYAFLFPLFFTTLLLLNEPAVSQEIQEKTFQKSQIEQNKKASEKQSVKENLRDVHAQKDVLVYQEEMVQETISEEVVRDPQPVREPLQEVRRILERNGTKEDVRKNLVNRQVVSERTPGIQTDMTKGFWYSAIEDGKYCIQFRGSKDASTWNMSECFDRASFTKPSENLFVLSKETGTLQLTGNLDAEVGQGKYIFTENASFRNFLSDKGLATDNENLMFHLFISDVNKAYVNFLKSEYPDLEARNLRDLAIHGVTTEKLKNYLALFQKHNKEKPSIQDVLSARIHGIDEAYVAEIQVAGYPDASLQKMMQAKIHGIKASYIQSLRSTGFKNLSLDEVVSAKIHGVDPAAVKELESLGYGKLDLEQVMQLKIHGIDAAYVNKLKSANLGELSFNQVLQAKIHNLDPETIQKIKSLGDMDLSFSEILTAKIHNVDIAYVEDLGKAGFKNISMDDLVSAKIHGINSNFIQEARKNGYDLNSLDKYISLKIHDRAMKSLKEE